MGYAPTIPLSFFEIGSAHYPGELTVSTVAGDKALSTIAIPNIPEPIRFAYFDIYLPYVHNSNAGVNHIEDSKIQVKTTGVGAYVDAVQMVAQSLYVDGATTNTLGRYVGNYDIASTIETCKGKTLLVKWASAQAHADNLLFRDVYTIVRILT